MTVVKGASVKGADRDVQVRLEPGEEPRLYLTVMMAGSPAVEVRVNAAELVLAVMRELGASPPAGRP